MADSTLISSSLLDREKVSIHQGMMWQQQPMRGGSITQTDYRAGKCTSVTLDPNISIFPPSFSDTQSPKSQGICSFWSRHIHCIAAAAAAAQIRGRLHIVNHGQNMSQNEAKYFKSVRNLTFFLCKIGILAIYFQRCIKLTMVSSLSIVRNLIRFLFLNPDLRVDLSTFPIKV